jgi:hypothetical protein
VFYSQTFEEYDAINFQASIDTRCKLLDKSPTKRKLIQSDIETYFKRVKLLK